MLNAQTGPGGVGNADGSASQPKNILWFDTNSLSLNDNDPVPLWTDRSGNGTDASQGTVVNQPLFKTNALNGFPIIYFDNSTAGQEDFLTYNGNVLVNTDFTAFYVAARRDNSQNIVLGGTAASSNQNLYFGWNDATQLICSHYGNDITASLSGDGSGYIGDGSAGNDYGIFMDRLSSAEAAPQRRVFQDGVQTGSINDPTQLAAYTGAAIGRFGSTPQYSIVNVAEIIYYTDPLNSAERIIVENYLAAKYNIDITTASRYSGASAGYFYNVAGIGRESDGAHSRAASAGFYVYENNTSFDNGEYIMFGHNNVPNSSSSVKTTSTVTNSGAAAAWNREWYLDATKTNGIDAKLIFDFKEALSDGQNPQNISNYVLLYRANTAANYSIVAGLTPGQDAADQVYFNITNADLNDGYYTIGTQDEVNSPVEGKSVNTWYSLVSGDWENPDIWTLDPSGALPNNPGHYTPSTSPSAANDKVVILSGRTVTISAGNNNKNQAGLRVDGRLDLTTTTGHNFGSISGSGRILLAAANFPAGDATDFITKGMGGGTVVYYGGNYPLTSNREFCNMEVIMDDPANTLTLMADYTLNGNLVIQNGILKINDDASTAIRTLIVKNDVTVESNGKILTGRGNTIGSNSIPGTMPAGDNYFKIFHQFEIYGNFTNHGTVRFTNQAAPVYNQFTSTGAVTVWFRGAANKNVTLYGTTDFYNLIVDKGTDQTYTLSIYSDNTSDFNLFGPNNVGKYETAPYSASDPLVRKALWIHNGTLKLTGYINIPTLSEGNQVSGNGDYAIGSNAGLWIAGSNVTVYSTASNISQISSGATGITTGSSNQAMSVFGKFRISSGFFGTRNSAGFIFWAASNAQLRIDGGTCYVAQVRSAAGTGGVASYLQTGGTMTVFGNEATYGGEYTGAYPLFGLETSDAVFQMTGGEIILQDDDGNASTPEFSILSSEGNYQVTGGTVKFELKNGRAAQIQSSANLWNMDLTNSSGAGNISLQLLSGLTVMGNVIQHSNTTLNADSQDLNIGGNWDYADGAVFTHGGNTTSFVGNTNSTIYIHSAATTPQLTLNNVNIYKDQNSNPALFDTVEINCVAVTGSEALLIAGNLAITRGAFDLHSWQVNLHGNINITDGEIMETGTPQGWLVLNGSAQQTLKGASTKEQSFGNIELNNSGGALLLSNVNVNDFKFNSDIIMNLDIYNLDVEGVLNGNSYGSTKMFETAGNASDGGLTRFINLLNGGANTTTVFPVGTPSGYTPVTITQQAQINDAGKITINPVNSYHPASAVHNKTIPYYWVVDTSGFSSVTLDDIKYTFTYNLTSIPGSASKLLNLWYENYNWTEYNKNIQSGNINFPYDAYLTGDFTVGNHSDFKNPMVYYSTTENSGNDTDFGKNDKWTDPSHWSTVGHYSTINAGTYPQQGDVAILGFGLSSPTATTDDSQRSHWFYADADIDVSKLVFADQVINQNGIAVPRSSSYLPQLIIKADNSINVNIGTVTGTGTFNVEIGCSTCNADPAVSVPVNASISADFGDFINNPVSRFDYDLVTSNNTAVYLPSSFPDIYPNIHIKGENGNNRTLIFQKDILIKGDLTIRENADLRLSNTTYGDIEVLGNLDMTINNTADILEFPADGPGRTLKVNGNIYMDNDNDIIRVLDNTNPSDVLVHKLQVGGDINQDIGQIDLYNNASSNSDEAVLELIGENDAEYTRTNNPPMELYQLVMNKLTGKNFTFQNDFTLNGPTNGSTKALELKTGNLILNDAGIDLTLSNGGADFKIPETASLTANDATIRLSGNNTGIWLDGLMHAGNGSKWYLDGGTNNYIEYTASGQSEIAVDNAVFRVGSQIRRSTITEEGILNFHEDDPGVDVVIGTKANLGGETSRGVFELVNTGCNFTQAAGAKLSIANAVNNATVPSFYLNLDPAEVILGAGSVIVFRKQPDCCLSGDGIVCCLSR